MESTPRSTPVQTRMTPPLTTEVAPQMTREEALTTVNEAVMRWVIGQQLRSLRDVGSLMNQRFELHMPVNVRPQGLAVFGFTQLVDVLLTIVQGSEMTLNPVQPAPEVDSDVWHLSLLSADGSDAGLHLRACD